MGRSFRRLRFSLTGVVVLAACCLGVPSGLGQSSSNPCASNLSSLDRLIITWLEGDPVPPMPDQGFEQFVLQDASLPRKITLRLLPPELRPHVPLGPVPFRGRVKLLGTFLHELPCPVEFPTTFRVRNPFNHFTYQGRILEWGTSDYSLELEGRCSGKSFGPWRISGSTERTTLVVARLGGDRIMIGLTPRRAAQSCEDMVGDQAGCPGENAEIVLEEPFARPRPVDTVMPKSPRFLQSTIAGEGPTCVSVGFCVTAEGTVDPATFIVLTAPHADLAAAAARSLVQWRFQPGMRNGKPVRSWVTTSFSFTALM